MKIKRFTESLEISQERIGDMTRELRELLDSLQSDKRTIESFLNELEDYKNDSQKGNDQIDDSAAAFQVIQKNLVDSIDKIDTVITNLEDYKENSRQYLYTETK